MNPPRHHIFEFTPDTLKAWCDQRGFAPFRARQILEWVYVHGVVDPASMSNLAVWERQRLAAEMTFLSGDVIADRRASDGVCKLLIQWRDDPAPPAETPVAAEPTAVALPITGDTSRQTECVLIPSDERRTACISSQVGCPVGCRFCASGLGGLDGNLSAGRIVEQVWRLCAVPGPLRQRITNVVFMGMGEPLSNFDAVTRAVRTICALAPNGLGISARKVTISTVGLPKFIDRLAAEFELPVTLALSLHAPTNDIRRALIPWSQYTTIEDLLAACQRWFNKTGREITLEYTLLRGVNDRPEHAEQLARLARTLRANINLIRYNEVAGIEFQRPRDADVLRFQSILRDRQINTHIRASRGRDIAAACGQLRHEGAGAAPA
ncbi:MAG: 23S rRNA (adenine(2503)-C(2))-methyltransferase RlmN [Phycisphaeraceae bacterium]|nr:23S rRNA (adenine(2503)-C(2))-methyltransferase RlmN [Phycisphaeraceae bacterium]